MSCLSAKNASVVFALAASLLGSACQPPPPATPLHVKKTVVVPSMKSKSQNGDAQDRGGIVLELPAPVFELKEKTTTTCRPAGTIRDSHGTPLYDIASETELAAMPLNVEFKLKVSNHSTKIVRLADVLLKLTINDTEAPVKADELKAATLRPSDTKEFSLVGPAWQSWPKQASVAFSVFGVPTEFDAANNVKKTENFEWAFDYTVTNEEKESKVVLDSQYLTPMDVASNCQSDGQDPAGYESTKPPSTQP